MVFVHPDLPHFLLFTELTISVAILFLGFSIMAGSLAFFLGNAETLYEQLFFSMITFSTYPFALFDGWVRVVLYTVIPAAFVSHYPVEALRHLSLADAGIALLGSICVLFFGACVFYLGLKRYESGNLLELRA
ncbi:MAG: ABC transporter permease [Cyanobacteria bacterium]|nr:ABC transporter permease [Cyanobacteriota bacterium]